MVNLNEVKVRIVEMSELSLTMWQTAFSAFMEHDTDLISECLKLEDKINTLEKDITISLVELAQKDPAEKKLENVLVYQDVVADLELIGDYIKDILERVSIKIEEKLLFSEEAVNEYVDLYQKTLEIFKRVNKAIKEEDYSFLDLSFKKQGHIDSLVDQLRRNHNQRLLEGSCQPFAGNMFLNMLDFTAAIYYHLMKIVRRLGELKRC